MRWEGQINAPYVPIGSTVIVPLRTQSNRLHTSFPQVTSIRDLTDGYDSTTPDKKPKLPLNIGGEMITYTFDVGATITLRTSGTEPKIKFYCEMKVCPWNFDRFLSLYAYWVNSALFRCGSEAARQAVPNRRPCSCNARNRRKRAIEQTQSDWK